MRVQSVSVQSWLQAHHRTSITDFEAVPDGEAQELLATVRQCVQCSEHGCGVLVEGDRPHFPPQFGGQPGAK